MGREDDPKGSPKSLVLPEQEKFQVPPATPASHDQVRAEVKTPVKTFESFEVRRGPQGSPAVRPDGLVPAVTEVTAANIPKTEDGGTSGLQHAPDGS